MVLENPSGKEKFRFKTPGLGVNTMAVSPDAKLVVFEESNHCPFLEEPDRFNQVVDDWIQSLP